VLRIKLRYDDVDAMVQRFAPNVGKSGLFLPTRSLQPVGTEVKFELRIANDTPVLVGLGRVKAAKAPDPANPRATFGMAIELMRVTREGREVIIRMIERRRAMGLPDVAIPMPEDLEAAKRADVDTAPRADTAAIIRDGMPAAESAPIVATRLATSPPESLLTAPRPSSKPFAVARSIIDRPSAPMLAPEPVRAKRPRLADVIAKASELSGSAFASEKVQELDEHVDIGKALARARALAGSSDLDAELAALRESSAAPLVEISVEAASAELARQLGGAAIGKRMRGQSAPVGVPISSPMTALGTVEVTTVPPARVDDAPVDDDAPREFKRPATSSSEMDQLAAEAAASITATRGAGVITVERADEPPAMVEPAKPHVEVYDAVTRIAAIHEPLIAPEVPRPAKIVEEDPELSSFSRALDAARVHTGVATPAAPTPETTVDDDDIAELDPDDIEELPGESTQIGQHPDPSIGTAPQAELADSLDRHLDDAESDAHEIASSIQAAALAYEAELAQVPEARADEAPGGDDFAEEEISDLDVLAEADADDADLLTSNAERDSQDAAPAYVPAEHVSHEHPAEQDLYAQAVASYAPPDAYAQPDAYGQPDPYANAAAPYVEPAAYAEPAPYVDPYVHDPYAPPQADALDPHRLSTLDPHAEAYPPDAYGEPASPPDPYAAQQADDPGYAAEHAYAQQVYAQRTSAPTTPQPRKRPDDEDFDFASQLDLGDDSGTRHPPAPSPDGYDIPSEYTLAERLPHRPPSFAETPIIPDTPGLDEALEFDEPHQFATQTPAPPTPRSPGRGSRAYSGSQPTRSPSEDSVDFDEPHGFVGGERGDRSEPDPRDDLESALSTLDVDLDHLEVPRAQRTRLPRAKRASDRGSRPLPGMPPERAPGDPPTGRTAPRPARQSTAPPARVTAKRQSAAPPLPAAPTRPAVPRAASEDDGGVLIDFDDDD
jgi:hypothetical protein